MKLSPVFGNVDDVQVNLSPFRSEFNSAQIELDPQNNPCVVVHELCCLLHEELFGVQRILLHRLAHCIEVVL